MTPCFAGGHRGTKDACHSPGSECTSCPPFSSYLFQARWKEEHVSVNNPEITMTCSPAHVIDVKEISPSSICDVASVAASDLIEDFIFSSDVRLAGYFVML